MGLIVAGDRSGVGKTTATLALLAALSRRSARVQSFKVGPDYIDPMFHRAMTGRPCYSLDPVLTSEDYVRHSYTIHSQNADYALVEGVMGLFDGASGIDDTASTAHIARLLNLPVLLVVDCARMSRSLAALVHGYRSFDPRLKLAGVVLNRVGSDRHLDLLKAALADTGVPILGVLRREPTIQIPDRHLGLVPTAEIKNLGALTVRLAELGKRSFDWSQLERWLSNGNSASSECPPSLVPKDSGKKELDPKPRIAIATDNAFSFYYPDNLDQLAAQGAELVEWSPLSDTSLPHNTAGLYFGGGFPEVFALELAQNQGAIRVVRDAIAQGMPTYAECGGLMYLSQSLTDLAEKSWPMVGTLPLEAKMASKLTLGYHRAVAQSDSPLLKRGQTVIGHEFHHSQAVGPLTQPMYQVQRYYLPQEPRSEGWCLPHLQASYVHLHWGDKPELARRFVECCWQYRCEKPRRVR
ncbi:cobyrinate a,c-diamide synthase [Romeria aff. gracilis LEGE 07310]|uniref:Cobyrinate a,c-diamide synthase n=1 Tax=Vasconcelosia minhoensis LEGE 07310 TaxID=915328 RepID=A0A8J7AY75_9CYAN|nr:cobyrinate a,c-diamide synthase [Romeria gracilis]MBE9078372.1 cobyrinate a,c-diamide synthase [Romeria aff. gracilis LEGE 07310]